MTTSGNVFNSRGEITMNRKGIFIATKEPHVYDWVHKHLLECDNHRHGVVSAPKEQIFQAFVQKPEMVMAFIETDFFGDKTIGMLEYLKKRRPKLRIIMFSVYDIPAETIARYLCWGADSYLELRDSTEQQVEVKKRIKQILEGERCVPESVWQYIDQYNGLPDKRPYLTRKEIEIVRFLAQGLVKKEIGAALDVSKKTIDNHISNIYGKFGIHNSVGVLKLAVSNGILPIEEILADTV